MLYAFFLIAIGIATENLWIAEMNGFAFSVFRNRKTMALLLSLFVVQSQILWYSQWIGFRIGPLLRGHGAWVALSLLISICLDMFAANWFHRGLAEIFMPRSKDMLAKIITTFVYVLAFGFSMRWIGIDERETKMILLPLLALFLGGGFLLGKWHLQRTFSLFSRSGPILAFTGALVLMAECITH